MPADPTMTPLPPEIEEGLQFACAIGETARLRAAISGALARVEKERDDWRHASGQDHEARRVAEEALAPWTERALRAEHDADMQREYGHRAGDALAAERARHAAAESESARLREALRGLLVAWDGMMSPVLSTGCTECHCGDAACEHDCETMSALALARACLSSSPATPENAAKKE